MERLNLIVLRCRDLDRSRAFYAALGMTFTRHRHGNGPEHLAHEDGRGVFELYPLAADAPADQTGLGFGSADLIGLAERLAAEGFEPQPIKANPWGTSFVVRDPDGRRVEVLAL